MSKNKAATRAAKTTEDLPVNSSTKMIVCLRLFLERGPLGLNALEANDLYNETCLNTTVSNIHRDFGWRLPRQYETYTNKAGRSTKFMRYWLSPEQRIEVKQLLDGLDREGDA